MYTTNHTLIIGLFGFGVVGEGIYMVLEETTSLRARIEKICIRHADKKRNAPKQLFTTDRNEILNNPEINTVVELIDDAEVAYQLVKEALTKGKSVVTANKKMLALHLDELAGLAKTKGLSLLYEASVCGSIPIIRNLEEYYDNDLLTSVCGIVNGSTNYILSRIADDGLTYAEALSEAQRLGFAETNPELDVEGYDAVNKLTLIIRHAFGLSAKPDSILRNGISRIHAADSRFAREKGYSIKLLAHARLNRFGDVVPWVLPQFVNAENRLYRVKNEFNGVLIGSRLSDEQFLSGKGAGRFPTASAVLSDISALRYQYNYEYRKSKARLDYRIGNDQRLKLYVSFDSGNPIDESLFSEIEERNSAFGRTYLIGLVNLYDLKLQSWTQRDDVSLILFDTVG